ncbi:MAG: Crp/Fnr family transcriptional regulator [Nitrospinales bacterium]
MKKIHIKKGTEIIKKGEKSGSAYVIESGKVEVSITNIKGKKRVLAILEEKAFFGELGLIDQLPRSVTVTALEDCVIGEITKEMFDTLSKKNPKALLPFLRIIAARVRETLKILDEYKHQPGPSRR